MNKKIKEKMMSKRFLRNWVIPLSIGSLLAGSTLLIISQSNKNVTLDKTPQFNIVPNSDGTKIHTHINSVSEKATHPNNKITLTNCFVPKTALTDIDHHIAKTAWTYYQNNYQRETGLFNSANQYPTTTMWDTGSALLMGGTITVKSKVNTGTTFTLSIPLKANNTGSINNSNKPLLKKNLVFYQPLTSITRIVEQQLANIGEQVESNTSLEAFLDRVAINDQQKDVFILDSENLTKNEISELLNYLTNHSIDIHKWLFIQNINGKHDELESYCEKHQAHIVVKPICQFTLYDAINSLNNHHHRHITATLDEKRSDFTGKTLLLVEDNKVNQMVAKALLKKLGLEVTVANDGLESLEAYKKDPFDIIFMDINMPNMSGIEATQELHKIMEQNQTQTPIIALTANVMEGAKEEYLSYGMKGYLSKPIDSEKLKAELNKWL